MSLGPPASLEGPRARHNRRARQPALPRDSHGGHGVSSESSVSETPPSQRPGAGGRSPSGGASGGGAVCPAPRRRLPLGRGLCRLSVRGAVRGPARLSAGLVRLRSRDSYRLPVTEPRCGQITFRVAGFRVLNDRLRALCSGPGPLGQPRQESAVSPSRVSVKMMKSAQFFPFFRVMPRRLSCTGTVTT